MTIRFTAPDNVVPMQTKLALLAEYASITTDGKLNILGIFDSINSQTFPAGIPIFFVVVSFDAGAAEFGTQKHIEVLLFDQDGAKELLRLEQTATVPSAPRAGLRSKLNLVNGIAGLGFTKAGSYQFSVLIDGREETTIPLFVNEVKGGE